MPLLESSSYRPPVWLRNGHINTIYPYYFRKKVSFLIKENGLVRRTMIFMMWTGFCQKTKRDSVFCSMDWKGPADHNISGEMQKHSPITNLILLL